MNNRITLELLAQDGLTPVLANLAKEAKTVQKEITEANRALKLLNYQQTGSFSLPDAFKAGGVSAKSMFGEIALGSFVAQGAMMAFQATIGVVTSSLGAMKNTLMDAATFQTQTLANASDIGTNLRIPLDEAKGIVGDVQKSISQMAAALPGVTQDYQAVFNGVAVSLAKQFRGDNEKFKEVSLEITKRVGMLAAIKKVDFEQSGSAINRFLGGTASFGELQRIDIFQKNPLLQDSMRQFAANMGLDLQKSKNWTSEQRLKVLTSALRQAAPESLAKEFEGTVDSVIQQIQTNMFDPLIGIFGFSRKVEAQGGRDVLDAVMGFFQSTQGLAKTLGNIGTKLGISFDPMEKLIGFIDWVSDIALGVNKWLSGLKIENLGDLFKGINLSLLNGNSGAMRSLVFNLMNGLGWLVKNIPWGEIGTTLGILSGQLFMAGIEYIFSWDFMTLLGDAILGVFNALGGFVIGGLAGLLSGTEVWIGDIGNWFKKIFDSTIGWLKDLWNKVTGWMGNSESISSTSPTATPSSPTGLFGTSLPGTSPLSSPEPLFSQQTKGDSVFAPQINLNGSNSSKSDVDNILSELDKRWSFYQSNNLAF